MADHHRRHRPTLIVQNDPQTSQVLTQVFKQRGGEVLTTENLKEAQRMVRRHKPALIVIDLHLLGDSWPSVLSRIQTRYPGTRVLFVDRGVSPEREITVAEHEHWSVLRPPFTKEQIDQALDAVSPFPYEGPQTERKRPAHPKVGFPIRAKITFPYMLLAFVLASAGALLITRIVFDTVEERFTNQLVEAGRLSTEWMAQEEGRMLETLRLLSHVRGISRALHGRDAEGLRELAFPIVVNAMAESVDFIDDAGVSVLSLRRRNGGRLEDYDFSQSDPVFAQWDLVSKVLERRADSAGDKFADLVSAPWGDFVYIAGPVLDENRNIIGAVLIGKSLSTLTKQMREATLAQATIFDIDGRPLATSHLESTTPLSSAVAKEILGRQEGESYLRPLTVSNLRYMEIIGPFEVRGGVDVGLLGVALPQTFIVRSNNITRIQMLSYLLGGLLLVIVLGILVANRLSHPIMRLALASREVAKGNLRVRVNVSGNDEVAVLAQAFNSMVDSLHRSKSDLLEAYDKTIEGWSTVLELRDEDTEGHTQRVAEMTVRLAREMKISEENIVHIRRGALLHDIGKMAIPDAILGKPGPLTDEEWDIMRKHPIFAYQMLSSISHLRPALAIPCCHHEKWDGSGYPARLKGKAIPLEARIFAVVDVWDALRSNRPYRSAWPDEQVVAYIQAEAGKHFDPQIVTTFMKIIRRDGNGKAGIRSGEDPLETLSRSLREGRYQAQARS